MASDLTLASIKAMLGGIADRSERYNFTKANRELQEHAPALARLVLRLAEALRECSHYTKCYGDKWPTSGAVDAAHTARALLAELGSAPPDSEREEASNGA